MTAATALEPIETLADLLDRLGGVPPQRVLFLPAPGTATEADLLRVNNRGRRLCELVEGTLVEKAMGALGGHLGGWIIHLLYLYLADNNIGELFAADSPMRLEEGLVRLPDVSFVRREHLPAGQIPTEPIAEVAPDLAIEVLSTSNTATEMRQKRAEYFKAGTRRVWEVDPERRVVDVYTSVMTYQTFNETQTLDGGDVLPGLVLPVRRIFERLPAR